MLAEDEYVFVLKEDGLVYEVEFPGVGRKKLNKAKSLKDAESLMDYYIQLSIEGILGESDFVTRAIMEPPQEEKCKNCEVNKTLEGCHANTELCGGPYKNTEQPPPNLKRLTCSECGEKTEMLLDGLCEPCHKKKEKEKPQIPEQHIKPKDEKPLEPEQPPREIEQSTEEETHRPKRDPEGEKLIIKLLGEGKTTLYILGKLKEKGLPRSSVTIGKIRQELGLSVESANENTLKKRAEEAIEKLHASRENINVNSVLREMGYTSPQSSQRLCYHVVKQVIATNEKNPPRCPECGKLMVKNGTLKNGKQKWLCSPCGYSPPTTDRKRTPLDPEKAKKVMEQLLAQGENITVYNVSQELGEKGLNKKSKNYKPLRELVTARNLERLKGAAVMLEIDHRDVTPANLFEAMRAGDMNKRTALYQVTAEFAHKYRPPEVEITHETEEEKGEEKKEEDSATKTQMIARKAIEDALKSSPVEEKMPEKPEPESKSPDIEKAGPENKVTHKTKDGWLTIEEDICPDTKEKVLWAGGCILHGNRCPNLLVYDGESKIKCRDAQI